MGHNESHPPCHCSHHRHSHSFSDVQPNRESHFSLERLNQKSQPLDGHAVVQRWLKRVATPIPTTPPVSPETQWQPAHDRSVSPCRPSSRRVDSSWRPQHVPPAQGSLSPCLRQLKGRERKAKRQQLMDGSPLLNDSSPCRELWKATRPKPPVNHQRTSSYQSRIGERPNSVFAASSPLSHRVVEPAFEKRPRHKTRADKYELKKHEGHKKRSKPADDKGRQPRESKSKRRKRHSTGKNVMDRFTSNAVLNERITVQPNLKPGLFNNKRASKKGPVTDLSFSSMKLPKYQEHEAQKGLSSSRLSEHQRKSREIENISSFFQPTCAGAPLSKSKPATSKDDGKPQGKRPTNKDNATPSLRQDSLATLSPSNTLLQRRHQNSSMHQENHGSRCTVVSNPDCRPDSPQGSKATTYFTWSSTQDSPQMRKHTADNQVKSIEPSMSATPEDERIAVIATGVYKGTGICPYDTSTEKRTHTLESHAESTSTNFKADGQENAHQKQPSLPDRNTESKLGCQVDGNATSVIPIHLEERWKNIRSPEWKLQRAFDTEESSMNDRGGELPDSTANVRPLSRQRIVREARAVPMQEAGNTREPCCHGDCTLATQVTSTTEPPVSIPHRTNDLSLRNSPSCPTRSTIASRDAMPPPPLVPSSQYNPLEGRNLNLDPGTDLNSSTLHNTAQPFETHIPTFPHEYAPAPEISKATSNPYEPGTDVERVIQNLNSVSWIPQAQTYTIVHHEREKTLSRLGMRSTIYKSQGRDEVAPEASHLTQHSPIGASESMADFIARIESEFEREIHIDEDSLSKSGTEAENPLTHPGTREYGIENGHITADGPDRGSIQASVDLMDPTSFTETTHQGITYQHDELGAAMRGETTSVVPTEKPKEETDDFLEMSNFWRPNQFSYL